MKSIIARASAPFQFFSLRRYVRENIGHALKHPNGIIASQVHIASVMLTQKFGA